VWLKVKSKLLTKKGNQKAVGTKRECPSSRNEKRQSGNLLLYLGVGKL